MTKINAQEVGISLHALATPKERDQEKGRWVMQGLRGILPSSDTFDLNIRPALRIKLLAAVNAPAPERGGALIALGLRKDLNVDEFSSVVASLVYAVTPDKATKNYFRGALLTGLSARHPLSTEFADILVRAIPMLMRDGKEQTNTLNMLADSASIGAVVDTFKKLNFPTAGALSMRPCDAVMSTRSLILTSLAKRKNPSTNERAGIAGAMDSLPNTRFQARVRKAMNLKGAAGPHSNEEQNIDTLKTRVKQAFSQLHTTHRAPVGPKSGISLGQNIYATESGLRELEEYRSIYNGTNVRRFIKVSKETERSLDFGLLHMMLHEAARNTDKPVLTLAFKTGI